VNNSVDSKHLQFGIKRASTVSVMTVILVLATFAVFLVIDVLTGKNPIRPEDDVRYFDHAQDGFSNLGVTMADGGKKI
jgi:hypothetical protein